MCCTYQWAVVVCSDRGLPLVQVIGYLNFELWTDVEGELVDDLRLDSRFPQQPTVSGCTHAGAMLVSVLYVCKGPNTVHWAVA